MRKIFALALGIAFTSVTACYSVTAAELPNNGHHGGGHHGGGHHGGGHHGGGHHGGGHHGGGCNNGGGWNNGGHHSGHHSGHHGSNNYLWPWNWYYNGGYNNSSGYWQCTAYNSYNQYATGRGYSIQSAQQSALNACGTYDCYVPSNGCTYYYY